MKYIALILNVPNNYIARFKLEDESALLATRVTNVRQQREDGYDMLNLPARKQMLGILLLTPLVFPVNSRLDALSYSHTLTKYTCYMIHS